MTDMPQQRKNQTGEPTKNGGEFGHARHDQADTVTLQPVADLTTAASRARWRLENQQPIAPQRMWASRDGYFMERITVLPALGGVGEQKIRATLSRNAYDHQSSAKVELFTAEGWTTVDHLAGNVVSELTPSIATMDEGKKNRAAALVLDALMKTSATILS